MRCEIKLFTTPSTWRKTHYPEEFGKVMQISVTV